MLKSIGAALLSIAMLGLVTVKGAPVCQTSHSTLTAFAEAIENEDAFSVDFYKLTAGCALLLPDFPATILDEGDGWIKVLVDTGYQGRSIEVYTIPEGVK